MDEKKKTVNQIIDYIEANLSAPERLNVGEIARYAGYSKFHINRMFSDVTAVPSTAILRSAGSVKRLVSLLGKKNPSPELHRTHCISPSRHLHWNLKKYMAVRQ